MSAAYIGQRRSEAASFGIENSPIRMAPERGYKLVIKAFVTGGHGKLLHPHVSTAGVARVLFTLVQSIAAAPGGDADECAAIRRAFRQPNAFEQFCRRNPAIVAAIIADVPGTSNP